MTITQELQVEAQYSHGLTAENLILPFLHVSLKPGALTR